STASADTVTRLQQHKSATKAPEGGAITTEPKGTAFHAAEALRRRYCGGRPAKSRRRLAPSRANGIAPGTLVRCGCAGRLRRLRGGLGRRSRCWGRRRRRRDRARQDRRAAQLEVGVGLRELIGLGKIRRHHLVLLGGGLLDLVA